VAFKAIMEHHLTALMEQEQLELIWIFTNAQLVVLKVAIKMVLLVIVVDVLIGIKKVFMYHHILVLKLVITKINTG
jgi:hypothetical protein